MPQLSIFAGAAFDLFFLVRFTSAAAVQPASTTVQLSNSTIHCKALNLSILTCYAFAVIATMGTRRLPDFFFRPISTRRSLPLEFLTFRSPYPLPTSGSSKSCICHSCENRRGVGDSSHFGTRSSSALSAPLRYILRFSYSTFEQTCKRFFHLSPIFSCSSKLFCALGKFNSFIFMQFRTLWAKTPGGGVPLLVSSQPSSAILEDQHDHQPAAIGTGRHTMRKPTP
jgi:hypothetical protein